MGIFPFKAKLKAFTLVEVTISLGIIAVSLLSIMALLAQAMDGAREAGGRTVGVQIGSQLMGEMQLMDWDSVIGHLPTYRYFDEFGEELVDGEGANEAVFTAYAAVENDSPILAGSGAVSTQLPCRQVRILVADTPGPTGQEIIENYQNEGRFSRRLHIHRSTVVNLEK